MGRIANALAAFGLAAAIAGLASCEPVQNPYGTAGATKAAHVGTSSGSNLSLPPPSSAGTVAGGTIDSPDSQGLSDFLKHHSLPLVGAQVVTSPSGGKQAILFGFVASEFGKADAEQKARRYLNDPSLVVDNRIKISPELSGGGSTGNGVPPANGAAPDGSNPGDATGSIQDYENNEPPGAQAYQGQGQQQRQYQQYNSAAPSMLSTILPMLLGGGVSMGSGGFGGGTGGFSSGYAPGYGSYGYPTYPPPMPGSGFGAPGYPY